MFERRSSSWNAEWLTCGLAAALGVSLGAGCAAACGVALLLAGQGALVLGPLPSARVLAGLLFLLGVAASLGFARALRAPLAALAQAQALPRAHDDNDQTVPRWLLCAAVVVLLVFVAAAILQTKRMPDAQFDAWAIWNARARTLLSTAGDVRFACDARRAALFTLHPEYPLLLPATIAIAWRLVGSDTVRVPALLSLLPALLCVAIAALAVAREQRRHGAWTWVILLTTPMFARWAAAQYAEMALGALVLAGMVLLLSAWQLDDRLHPSDRTDAKRPERASRDRLVFLAGLALGLSASVKHEGTLALGSAGMVLGLTRPRDLLAFSLGAAAPLALLAWFSLVYAPPGDLEQGGFLAVLHRAQQPHRMWTVASMVLRRLYFFPAWALHLCAFTLALGIGLYRNDLGQPARRLLLFCALVFAGFLAAYLTTPHDLEWHIRSSIDRLFLQLWPAAVVALALQRKPRGAPEPS